MFVHTYFCSYAIIIDVTPPIHYIVFATPHKKRNTFSKEDSRRKLSSLLYIEKQEEVLLARNAVRRYNSINWCFTELDRNNGNQKEF